MTKRILVVDDDPASLDHTARTLIHEGFETVLDSSGEAAMHHLAVDSFDAVVSEVTLPGMSGFELLENILIQVPGLPVILVTASRHDGLHEAAFVCGATELLEKPVDAGRLIGALESSPRCGLRPEPAKPGETTGKLEEQSDYQLAP